MVPKVVPILDLRSAMLFYVIDNIVIYINQWGLPLSPRFKFIVIESLKVSDKDEYRISRCRAGGPSQVISGVRYLDGSC